MWHTPAFLIIPGQLRLAIVPTDRGFRSITEELS